MSQDEPKNDPERSVQRLVRRRRRIKWKLTESPTMLVTFEAKLFGQNLRLGKCVDVKIVEPPNGDIRHAGPDA